MNKLSKKISKIIEAGVAASMFGCPIDGNNAFDCANPVQAGITYRLWLYNWEDWKAGAITEDVDGTITAYTNGSTLQGYSFDVSEESNIVASSALTTVDGGADGYTHTIDSRAFDVSEVGAKQISKMRFQKIVAIIERLDGTAKVYGRNVGMRLSDFQFNEGTTDTGGVIQYVLATPDGGAPENEVPTVLDAGDPAATKAILDALTTPGV